MAKNLTYNIVFSSVNPAFWSKLTEIKLNIDKLSESGRHIWGYFNNLNKECQNSIVEVDSTSFNENFNPQQIYVPFHGTVYNLNTIEQFKECNKTDLINKEGSKLQEKIKNGAIIEDPSQLNNFTLLCFADLKKYHYYYWFAYPVPKDLTIQVQSEENLQTTKVPQLYNEFQALDAHQKTYFLVHKQNYTVQKLATIKTIIDDKHDYYFAFYNNSNKPNIPGSQLRNYVAFILHYCPFLQGKSQQFLAFNVNRENSQVTCSDSIILDLVLPTIDGVGDVWVGWEKNERDKMGPKLANMKSTLDPNKLVDDAVDLNLKLMKWRIMPDINLEIIKNSKCLLLGAGTLGCSVARTLLAWGVRHITFADNSTVSYSNPVRQSLFTFQDSLDGKSKSLAAADNLRKIFPGVVTAGYQLTIPMPGHSIGESILQGTKEAVDTLCRLIEEHDVIFLLMDSRESRWLPTLLGNVYDKVVINAALGFDTYLVMRHGAQGCSNGELRHPEGFKALWGNQLGCYFCNDVTAPGNSLKDRTLDQQCTVTRPGVSQIAGALAVELAVSLLQHPEKNNAPAFYQIGNKAELDPESEAQCVLGLLPHSIRGFLSSFTQVLPGTQKFKQCIACSSTVIQEYTTHNFDFLLKVFNSSKYLEDLTGLTEMFKESNCGEIWEFSDDDED